MSTSCDLTQFEASLPDVPAPVANYVPFVQAGNLLYTSGMLPMKDGQLAVTGVLSAEADIPKGQEAARLACLNALSVLKSALGSLSRVERVVKLTAYVASSATFTDQPLVVNGASDLLVEVFGDKGRHARAAVGVASLPKNASVEVELIVQIAS
jgi:enamine deaminase RidA (YjgF/YER057c/UK114 family)